MRRTWKVLVPFDADGFIELACTKCGSDARLPTNGSAGCLIIAAFGLGLVTDPPGSIPRPGFMPAAIQCRACGTVWDSRPEVADVRQAV